VAERFYAAVAAKEGERACAQLTPGLALFFFCLFLAALALQSLTGWQDFNNDQYVGTADFWERTMQNWQSEFLAVGSMAIFARVPAPAWVAGVQAGGSGARRHGHHRLISRTATG